MDPASTTLDLITALVLIGLIAFFTAAEHSLIAARRTRLEPLARAGSGRARKVLNVLESPADTIAAAQLGGALATLGLGVLAEHSIHGVLHPTVEAGVAVLGIRPAANAATHGIALTLTLLLLSLVHLAIGSQLARIVAADRPERVAGLTLPPLRLFGLLTWPVLRVARALSGLAARVAGADPAAAQPLSQSAEELRMLVEQGAEGPVEADQEQMLLGVIHLRDTLVREVMTPRRDIIALPVTATREETLALVAEGHSRIPVYAESIDDVIGILLVKDLLTYVIAHPSAEDAFDLRTLVREPHFVPDTKRVGELLPELRTKSVHMAIVLDEFGGTDGLVTLEDMLEEIVGDIFDEHDVPEDETDFSITDSGDVLIDGSASIFDVNEKFGLALPEQDYDTIGGFVFGELGRVPVAGDVVPLNGSGELRVDEVEERRVTRVRLVLAPPVDSPSPVEADA